ncbi:zinc metallopeptidase [Planctomycetota bacterium]
MYMPFDPMYFLFAAPGAIISFVAQRLLMSRVKKHAVPNLIGLTGAEIAKKMLEANGITDVKVEHVAGSLSDHYSPSEKVLRLSDIVHDKNTVTALGVAAHEVGHAIQHHQKYGPLVVRQTVAPFAVGGQKLSMIILFAGGFLAMALPALQAIGWWLALAACILFSLFVLFTLVTLPVEFNASARAMNQLAELQLSGGEEWINTKKVLNAAALTYVAAAAAAIGTFLYFLFRSGLLTGGRR